MRPFRSHIAVRWLFGTLLVSMVCNPPTASPQSREQLLKAGYIEKFTHFIEWPPAALSGDTSGAFAIALLGEDGFDGAVDSLFRTVRVKNRGVVVSHISSLDEIKECAILIIDESESGRLGEILKRVQGNPILTVGATPTYGKRGVMINMYREGNFIRFEINRAALERSGLKASSLLLSSAKLVSTDE